MTSKFVLSISQHAIHISHPVLLSLYGGSESQQPSFPTETHRYLPFWIAYPLTLLVNSVSGRRSCAATAWRGLWSTPTQRLTSLKTSTSAPKDLVSVCLKGPPFRRFKSQDILPLYNGIHTASSLAFIITSDRNAFLLQSLFYELKTPQRSCQLIYFISYAVFYSIFEFSSFYFVRLLRQNQSEQKGGLRVRRI